MLFRILLAGLLIGGVLMALSFISVNSSNRKRAVSIPVQVEHNAMPKSEFVLSFIAILKFFWSTFVLAIFLGAAFILFKFIGLL